MAKGQLDHDIPGVSETVYTVNFGTNAQVRVEQAFQKPYFQVLREFMSMAAEARGGNLAVIQLEQIRKMLRAVLVSHPQASLDEVGEIIDDMAGGPVAVLKMFMPPPTEASGTEVEAEATTEPTTH